MFSSSFRRMLMGLLLALVLLPACESAPPVKRQALYLSCSEGESLLVHLVDPQTGQLKETQQLKLPGRVGPIAPTDDGEYLYVALNNPPRILPMQRDTATGLLTPLEATEVPAHPTYLDIDATGNYAVSASYGAGVVQIHRILDDHSIRQGPPHYTLKTERTAHASLIDPSNRFVYIPHTTPNAIYQLRFDENEGKLAPIPPIVVKGGGKPNQPAGPRHYTYHPTLGVVYVVNELDSSVSAYQWDRESGALVRFQSLSTLPGNFGGRNTCADIHITPDGRFLYASNRGHNSLAAYKLDKDGLMTLIDWFETEPVPREFAIDTKGQYLYSAGQRSNQLAAYAIDSNTGRLSRIGNYDTPKEPLWVEVLELD